MACAGFIILNVSYQLKIMLIILSTGNQSSFSKHLYEVNPQQQTVHPKKHPVPKTLYPIPLQHTVFAL